MLIQAVGSPRQPPSDLPRAAISSRTNSFTHAAQSKPGSNLTEIKDAVNQSNSRLNITHDSALHPALLQLCVQMLRRDGLLKSYRPLWSTSWALAYQNLYQFGTVVSQIDPHGLGVHGIPCLQIETVPFV